MFWSFPMPTPPPRPPPVVPVLQLTPRRARCSSPRLPQLSTSFSCFTPSRAVLCPRPSVGHVFSSHRAVHERYSPNSSACPLGQAAHFQKGEGNELCEPTGTSHRPTAASSVFLRPPCCCPGPFMKCFCGTSRDLHLSHEVTHGVQPGSTQASSALCLARRR